MRSDGQDSGTFRRVAIGAARWQQDTVNAAVQNASLMYRATVTEDTEFSLQWLSGYDVTIFDDGLSYSLKVYD